MAFYKFPFEKYRFHVVDTKNSDGQKVKKVIAISTYAGKPVRGVAICSVHDEFDLEKGKRLAAARCNEKVAKLRYKNSSAQLDYACSLVGSINKYHMSKIKYNMDAYGELEKAHSELVALESKM